MDYCCYFGLPQVNNESESEGTEIEPLILIFFSFSFYFLSSKMKSFEILGEGMVIMSCVTQMPILIIQPDGLLAVSPGICSLRYTLWRSVWQLISFPLYFFQTLVGVELIPQCAADRYPNNFKFGYLVVVLISRHNTGKQNILIWWGVQFNYEED